MRTRRNGPARAGLCTGLLLLATAAAAPAGTLLDPAPQRDLRPLSTDRPDVTESPYTVDAGHVQVEADAFVFSRKDDGGLRSDELRLAQVNVKVGLFDRADLQLVLAPYVKSTLRFSSLNLESVGSGDLLLRLKVNLTGNDGGPAAVALLPFVAPPTASDAGPGREPAYGLAVPAAFALPGGLGLGVMAQLSAQDADRAYLISGSLSRALGARVGGFLEVAAERVDRPDQDPLFSPTGPTDYWNTTLDTGVTVGVTPDLQLDGALRFGLTDAAADWSTYAGVTVRR